MSEVPYPPPTSHHPLTAEGSPYPALPTITTNYRAPVNGARNERGVLTSRAERRRDEDRVRKNDESDRRAPHDSSQYHHHHALLDILALRFPTETVRSCHPYLARNGDYINLLGNT